MLELDKVYALNLLENELSSTPRNQAERKKMAEARIICLALRHMFPNTPPDVVIPDDRYDKAPDGQYIEPGTRKRIGVEVVSFTEYSGHEGLSKFFGRTKLAPTVAYPPDTRIVCDVQTRLVNPTKTASNLSRAIRTWEQPIPYQVFLYYHPGDEDHFSQLV